MLPGPALSRTDVTSGRSSALHWQGKKLDREPMGPRALPLGRCQEPLLAGSEDLCKGPPSESGRARNSPSATQTSQSFPLTTLQGRAQAVHLSAVIKHLLCARPCVWLFLGHPMPAPRQPAQLQTVSFYLDFNPHPGLGLQAGWAVFPGSACSGLPVGSGSPWHTD